MYKTFFSYSFGCRVNQAEKEHFDQKLLQLGYQFDEKNPHVYVINTCAVTHKAEREARQLIYQIKRKNPSTKIVVTGCAATNWIKQRIKIDEVDYIVDNQNKEYLASLIEKNLLNSEVKKNKSQNVSGNQIQDKFLNSKRIFIKIQDGCQRFCTFCIVPYLRGLPKSKSVQEIVDQMKSYENTIQEVSLVAINTEAFGYDTKEKFIDLLQQSLVQTKIPRISFGSIHPWSVNDDFFTWYTNVLDQQRIVDFFHIPLQSGSNKILQLMKRGYTREEFIEKLKILHTINPFAQIGTDIIAGFLEETDKDFDDTYKFLEETPINRFHVFRFSKRNHTAAFYLAKRLKEPTAEEKSKRSKLLVDLGKKKYDLFLRKHLGQTFSTLFLEKRDGEIQHGLLSNQIPVVVNSPKNIVGEIKNVRIINYKNGELHGKII